MMTDVYTFLTDNELEQELRNSGEDIARAVRSFYAAVNAGTDQDVIRKHKMLSAWLKDAQGMTDELLRRQFPETVPSAPYAPESEHYKANPT